MAESEENENRADHSLGMTDKDAIEDTDQRVLMVRIFGHLVAEQQPQNVGPLRRLLYFVPSDRLLPGRHQLPPVSLSDR